MHNTNQPIPLLNTVFLKAMDDAFQQAIDVAKQTRTGIAIWENDAVRTIPYDQIDAFLAERAGLGMMTDPNQKK